MKPMRHSGFAAARLYLFTLLIAGCATGPYVPPKVSAPSGVTLPVRARVAVQVNPTMPGWQTVEFRGETWQYPDTELMQQAAIRMFREAFTEVGTTQSLSEPTVTVVLNGSSSVNPIMNEYYANATATVFPGGDTYTQPLATFSGSGTGSQPNFSQGGIATAYEGAFRQIADRMLANGALLAKLRGK
jgi:hypothetical protein